MEERKCDADRWEVEIHINVKDQICKWECGTGVFELVDFCLVDCLVTLLHRVREYEDKVEECLRKLSRAGINENAEIDAWKKKEEDDLFEEWVRRLGVIKDKEDRLLKACESC